MTVSKISVLVIILVGMFVAFRLLQTPDSAVVLSPSVQEVPSTESIVEAVEPVVEPEPEPALEEPPLRALDQPGCLTIQQFEALPEIRQDAARLESVSSSGDALNAYQNIGAETIQNYANQGDSGAMAVLGAISVMRAYEKDDSQAIGWLNGEQLIPDMLSGNGRLSADASLALNDAAYWFYEAASHGRLMALQQYGQVRGRLFGGPVGLGWIDQAEYDALSARERTALIPRNLFGQVSFDVAPKLRDGAIGGLLSNITPTSDLQKEIRERLRDEFNQSIEDRGLPRIEVAAAATTNIEELMDRVCDSVKHEEIRRRSLE